MDEAVLARFRAWFEQYVASFIPRDEAEREAFRIKREHSLRVQQEMDGLVAGLGMSGHEVTIALLCALLHDIGRFSQYRRYATFADLHSTDHGALGAAVLTEHGVLDKLDPVDRAVILEAIRFHNQRAIPAELCARGALHCRLLRDADKLDIFFVVLRHYSQPESAQPTVVGLDLPDPPTISPAVCADLLAGRLARHEDCRGLNDFKLLQMGWVYDLNFRPSCRRMEQCDYLSRLRATLPASAEIDRLYQTLNRFLQARCDETT
jgi:putative nucleotidyltransferase with HDIG domain